MLDSISFTEISLFALIVRPSVTDVTHHKLIDPVFWKHGPSFWAAWPAKQSSPSSNSQSLRMPLESMLFMFEMGPATTSRLVDRISHNYQTDTIGY